jgi:myo-inositol-1-phosphate synthase
MTSVRVAVVGVGNCAASLVQGVQYYRDADPTEQVPGLMHVRFGDYHVSDVEFVAAFDVAAKKVGRDLSEAIVASESNTIKIAEVPPLNVTVQRGHTLDGLGKCYRQVVEESDEEPVDVVAALREARADVLVCYLPVGSEDAARFYAQAAIDAKVAFVNALPVFIAGTPRWAAKFAEAGVPIIGDDVKSQVEVWDSAKSAGVIIDAVRAAKIALDRGIGGPILSASSYFMKSPPEQRADDVARASVEAFIRGEIER